MARVSTYLNFSRQTEAAFIFYSSVFNSEIDQASLMRFRELPPSEGMPAIREEDKDLIVHMELPILGGHVIMGTDAPESLGFKLKYGDNIHINLEPDTFEETHRLFRALSQGGKVIEELGDIFWGGIYGSCSDRFGVQWMFNCKNG